MRTHKYDDGTLIAAHQRYPIENYKQLVSITKVYVAHTCMCTMAIKKLLELILICQLATLPLLPHTRKAKNNKKVRARID